MFSLPIFKLRLSKFTSIFLARNKIYFVLDTFKVSLLALNHTEALDNILSLHPKEVTEEIVYYEVPNGEE